MAGADALNDLGDLLAPSVATGVTWSIEARDADSGERLAEHEPTTLVPTASVGKLFLLVEVADGLVTGRLAADTPVTRGAVPLVGDSGLWQHLAAPTLSVADAAALVGAVSDNHATNVLLDLVGLGVVRVRAASLARGGSALTDVVRSERGPGDPAALSVGCATDLVTLAVGLARGAVVSSAVSAQVVQWLAAGVDTSMVASAWGLDPLAHTPSDAGAGGTWLWSKTGSSAGVRADVGVVTTPRRRVAYAVLAAWDGVDAREPVLAAMRALGGRLRDLG